MNRGRNTKVRMVHRWGLVRQWGTGQGTETPIARRPGRPSGWVTRPTTTTRMVHRSDWQLGRVGRRK